jgi:hypothetical protein
MDDNYRAEAQIPVANGKDDAPIREFSNCLAYTLNFWGSCDDSNTQCLIFRFHQPVFVVDKILLSVYFRERLETFWRRLKEGRSVSSSLGKL